MKRTIFLSIGLAAFLLASCASSGGGASAPPPSKSQSGIPPEIVDWTNKNSATTFYGLGISEYESASDAYQQASVLAREDLAAKLETEVASISENYVKRAEAKGETDRISSFNAATRQQVRATLQKVQSYGPYKIGNATYVIAFLDQKNTKQDLASYVDEVFADTKAELQTMLNN